MLKMRLLVVEDDRRMAQVLRQTLEEEGHTVTLAFDGREGLELAARFPFELLVLDVMLPGIDGFAIAKKLRESSSRTPILMLTARDRAADVVRGLDLGADDYLTKPFSLEVLLARVRALGRRGPIPQSLVLRSGDLALHTGTRDVTRGLRHIHLTRTEHAVLELLLRASGRVVTREQLMENVWGDAGIESNTLDAFIRLLRAKVEATGEAKLIHTVRAVGYCLRAEQP
ncbi:MAG: response regulator transcription factor [Bryobacteraceae bacterium]